MGEESVNMESPQGDSSTAEPSGKGGAGRKTGKYFAALVLALVAAAAGFLTSKFYPAGNPKSSYEREWRRITTEFDRRVERDDRKAEAYSKEQNVAGLMRLAKRRISYFSEVAQKLLEIKPPPEYGKVHVLTLYYIYTLIDQLEAQNDLNDAILSGKPTEDLKKIADGAKTRSQLALNELTVEIQKSGVSVEAVGKAGTEKRMSK